MRKTQLAPALNRLVQLSVTVEWCYISCFNSPASPVVPPNTNKNNTYLLAVSWTIAVTIAALVFMPKFREMNCTSAYEVYSHSALILLCTKMFHLVFRKTLRSFSARLRLSHFLHFHGKNYRIILLLRYLLSS